MKNWNPNLDKAALLRHMGSVSQLGGLKRYTYGCRRAVYRADHAIRGCLYR